MKKIISGLLLGILVLSLFLVGCKSQTPTDVVQTYFENVKKGDTEESTALIKSTLVETEEIEEENGIIEESNDEVDAITKEALEIYLSKLEAKILSENIDGEKATVEVEVTGLNYANLILEVVSESLGRVFEGEDFREEDMNSELLEKVKEGSTEKRTGTVSLVKEDKEWKIESDDDLFILIMGQADFGEEVEN